MASVRLLKEIELESGDLILFRGTTWLSTLLEYAGHSKYSHVGIIIKNPRFLDENLEDGLYLLDSSYGYKPDEEDHQMKYGVQLHKLDDIISLYPPGAVYMRKVKEVRDEAFYERLARIHQQVRNKPYDLHICDWIEAKMYLSQPIPVNPLWKWTDRFWCSSLVTFIYHELGWVQDCNWGLIAPCEYSSADCTGKLFFTCIIGEEELLA